MITFVLAVMLKVRSTGVAGAKLPLPACVAWIVHGPTATRVTEDPATEQVVGDVASRLIDLHGEAGDAAGIQWVIQRARRGLDGSIAELPHRLVERIWAARLADPGLTESTAGYERELAATVDDDDPSGDYEVRSASAGKGVR